MYWDEYTAAIKAVRAEEEKNKIILSSFGYLAASVELMRSLEHGAEVVRQIQRDIAERETAALLYDQCAYGL